ncbi:hypothetical protein DFH09DRAFT_1366386 [Mycena vulgaris]|nr:hypothetical protein DFH09DRAFT_1366386 [Mycena vulgaris]
MRFTFPVAVLWALATSLTASAAETSPAPSPGSARPAESTPFSSLLTNLRTFKRRCEVTKVTTTPPRSILPSDRNRRSAAAPRSAYAPFLSNADRFRRGLSLRPPARRPAQIAWRSSTPGITQPHGQHSRNTDASCGFIAPALNDLGQSGHLVPTQIDAMVVSLTYSVSEPDALIDLKIIGGISQGFFGGVVGYASISSDIGTGDAGSNYNVLGPVAHTVPNSPSSDGASGFSDYTYIDEPIESGIWHFSPGTNALLPQWMNTNGDTPATEIIYVEAEPLFAIMGDLPTFHDAYGVGTPVYFTFVLSPPPAPVPAPER